MGCELSPPVRGTGGATTFCRGSRRRRWPALHTIDGGGGGGGEAEYLSFGRGGGRWCAGPQAATAAAELGRVPPKNLTSPDLMAETASVRVAKEACIFLRVVALNESKRLAIRE